MRLLRTLVMLLGALAVLATGFAPAAAAASEAPPPCHDTASHHQGPQTPSPDPAGQAQIPDCCVACIASPPLQPPARARLAAPRPATLTPRTAMLAGERPAPEPHPPRLFPA